MPGFGSDEHDSQVPRDLQDALSGSFFREIETQRNRAETQSAQAKVAYFALVRDYKWDFTHLKRAFNLRYRELLRETGERDVEKMPALRELPFYDLYKAGVRDFDVAKLRELGFKQSEFEQRFSQVEQEYVEALKELKEADKQLEIAKRLFKKDKGLGDVAIDKEALRQLAKEEIEAEKKGSPEDESSSELVELAAVHGRGDLNIQRAQKEVKDLKDVLMRIERKRARLLQWRGRYLDPGESRELKQVGEAYVKAKDALIEAEKSLLILKEKHGLYNHSSRRCRDAAVATAVLGVTGAAFLIPMLMGVLAFPPAGIIAVAAVVGALLIGSVVSAIVSEMQSRKVDKRMGLADKEGEVVYATSPEVLALHNGLGSASGVSDPASPTVINTNQSDEDDDDDFSSDGLPDPEDDSPGIESGMV